MVVYNGKLYITAENYTGIEVCRYDDNNGAAGTLSTVWSRVTHGQGTIRSGGSSTIRGTSTMTVYNGKLYLGVEKANSAELYYYTGLGTDWTLVNSTPGTIASGGTANIDKITMLIPFNNSLYIGTGENNGGVAGAEIYEYKNTSDQSYALKFRAPAQNGEVNGQLNEASIWYSASSSGSMRAQNGAMGSFMFSTGITTTGGALALGVGDRVLMLEYATYSVISPESCAAILWRDTGKAELAAKSLRLTADEVYKFKVVDSVIREPRGGAHRSFRETAENLKVGVKQALEQLYKLPQDQLVDQRYERFRNLGVFSEDGQLFGAGAVQPN
jgi:hypothetical protein